jgi:hypothetical protein
MCVLVWESYVQGLTLYLLGTKSDGSLASQWWQHINDCGIRRPDSEEASRRTDRRAVANPEPPNEE